MLRMVGESWRRRRILGGLAALSLPAAAQPDTYPNRAIRIFVPFAPGGASDFVARVLQPHLNTLLGQPIIVENRTGGAGNTGMEAAARAAPDGYTLFLGNVGTLAVNPTVFAATLRVRPQTDFAPISVVGDSPDVLIVTPTLPARSVAELVRLAAAQPGALAYGSPGAGSINRLEMDSLMQGGGAEMMHVPFSGGAGQAVTAVMAGHVAAAFVSLPSTLGQVQGNRVRALAVTGRARAASLPDVPTMGESGFPEFASGSWQGLVAPAGTPEPIIARWHAALTEVLGMEAVRQRLFGGGVEPQLSPSPAAFGAFIASEEARWGAIARQTGARAE